ncbi:MAG: capsule biosynthesis GfcC D2 domain-containing protein [Scandinavium sp.]|uniref:capsule biosynthesis GfcC D2 domain-containing protein n=1 Tax=Scandinavium sp. TaxID=2830653 RepID=UPI003F32C69F
MKMLLTLLTGTLLLATSAHAAKESVVTINGPQSGQQIRSENVQTLAQLVTSPEVSANAWWPGTIITTPAESQKAKAQQQQVLRQLSVWEQQAKAPLAATLRSVQAQLASITVAGRLRVNLDPDVVRTQPDADVRLQGEYQLYLTTRPDTVTLLGAIDSPGEQRWRPATSVSDYFNGHVFLAGADTSHVTVISPSGEPDVAPIAQWNDLHREAEPGSVIWVGFAEDEQGLNEQIIRLLAQREAKQ